MNNSNKQFKSMIERGEEFEMEIDNIYRKAGYVTFPGHQHTSRGYTPSLFKNNRNFIAPDIIIFKGNRHFWVECKHKTRWIDFTGKLETGINQDAWEGYKDLFRETGMNIIFFFDHRDCDQEKHVFRVSIQSLMDMESRMWDGTNKYTGQTVEKPEIFWKFEDLKPFICGVK